MNNQLVRSPNPRGSTLSVIDKTQVEHLKFDEVRQTQDINESPPKLNISSSQFSHKFRLRKQRQSFSNRVEEIKTQKNLNNYSRLQFLQESQFLENV